MLASAGLLDERRATSHWVRLPDRATYGAVPVDERVVFDGTYVTIAGVSSGIAMVLTPVDRMAGQSVAEAIKCGIECDPDPPYDAGSPSTVDPQIVDMLLDLEDVVL